VADFKNHLQCYGVATSKAAHFGRQIVKQFGPAVVTVEHACESIVPAEFPAEF
jgi:hypothetical protein